MKQPAPAASMMTAGAEEAYEQLRVRPQAGLDYAGWVSKYHDRQDAKLAAATYKRLVDDVRTGILGTSLLATGAQSRISFTHHIC